MAPVDYSRWDALELSDDSDIEVHPNVDKRSFIRAKQHQIHQERLQRKHDIERLKYEHVVNQGLITRISAFLASLRAHASEAATQNPGEVAFQAIMESARHTKDDEPPRRPEGVLGDVNEPPTYSKMMATLLDQVNKALDKKKPDNRYSAMVDEITEHKTKVENLQSELEQKLEELEQEERKKITSADIHTGFNSSLVTKSEPSGTKDESTRVELLNPQFSTSKETPRESEAAGNDDDEKVEASVDGKRFAQIRSQDLVESQRFLAQHLHLLTERETDGLLALAFEAGLKRKDEQSRKYVHQALLLQYCRALGKDGVSLFFRRMMTPGHQARDIFGKDVQETYTRIKNRSLELLAQRDEVGATEGVEQIQLHAIEPGMAIQIRVPPADSTDADIRRARDIFDRFTPEMKRALESGKLDEVNKVLSKLSVDEGEKMVQLFGEAGILSLEEQLIDATTEAGQQQLKHMEAEATSASQVQGEGHGLGEEVE